MKNSKRLLIGAACMATLGALTLMPVNAYYNIGVDVDDTDLGVSEVLGDSLRVPYDTIEDENEYSQEFLDFIETYNDIQEQAMDTLGLNDMVNLSGVAYSPTDFQMPYTNLIFYDGKTIVQYGGTINHYVEMHSAKDGLTVDDLLTEEQLAPFYSESTTQSDLPVVVSNKGYNEETGLYDYTVTFKVAYSKLDRNTITYLEYQVAQSWLDDGLAESAEFVVNTFFDDYNNVTPDGDLYIYKKDGTSLTADDLEGYEVESIKQQAVLDGGTLNGEHYYYRVTLAESENVYKALIALQQNENFSFVLASDWLSTELWMEKDWEYYHYIPVVSSKASTTIGDSTTRLTLNETPTGIRGDVNYDGEVNAVDLLVLKKYLLQMVTW